MRARNTATSSAGPYLLLRLRLRQGTLLAEYFGPAPGDAVEYAPGAELLPSTTSDLTR